MTKNARNLVLLLTSLTGVAIADPPEQTARPTAADLSQWWADLAGPEPEASRALLHFAAMPTETTAFFKTKLRPLKLTTEELEPLLEDLGSEDDAVWKPAFEKLETLDPRLAMGLVDLMRLVTDDLPRSRLVDILCGAPAGTYKASSPIKLEKTGADDAYNFRSGNGSWWAEVRIDRVGAMSWGAPKRVWTCAVRAIVLLQHFGTPEAKAIVADMATGHPDALPTKVAKDPMFKLPNP